MIVRKGKKEDLGQAMALIRELAEFEKEPYEVETTVHQMEQDAYGPQPVFEFFVAEEPATRHIVGLALYFYSYSTWKGKCLYLEDLIVTRTHRGRGIGKKLFDRIMQQAKAVDARRVVWQVLDWNEPAIRFYQSLGAAMPKEWVTCRLTREQIQQYQPVS